MLGVLLVIIVTMWIALAVVLQGKWNKALAAHHTLHRNAPPRSDKLGTEPAENDYRPWTRQDEKPMGLVEALGFSLGAFALVPIRFLIILFSLLAGWFVLKVPGGNNRRVIATIFPPLSRAILFGFGVVRVNNKGLAANVAARPPAPLIVGNHVCYLEAFVMVSTYAPSFVAKASVQKLPLLGAISSSLQVVFAQRTEKSGLTKRILERCQAWEKDPSGTTPLAMFPEGTTTNGHYMIKFRTGAFVNGYPVQPVSIHFDHDESTWKRCWGSEMMPLPLHLLRLMATPFTAMTVTHLPVIVPSKEEKANPTLYAENVRAAIAATLSSPVVNHDYTHKQVYMEKLTELRKGGKALPPVSSPIPAVKSRKAD